MSLKLVTILIFACSEKWMLNDIGGFCKLVVPGCFSLTYLLFIILLIKGCLQCASLPILTISVSLLIFFFFFSPKLHDFHIFFEHREGQYLKLMDFQRNSCLKQSGRQFQAKQFNLWFWQTSVSCFELSWKRQKSFPEPWQSTFFYLKVMLKCIVLFQNNDLCWNIITLQSR